MQRSRRILYMSRQRPFGSLLKRLLSHSRNKDSPDIYSPDIFSGSMASPSIFDIRAADRGSGQLTGKADILPRANVAFVESRQTNEPQPRSRAKDFPESRSRSQFATCGVERESNIEIPGRKRIHLLILGNSWGKHTRCNLLLKESPLIAFNRKVSHGDARAIRVEVGESGDAR